MSTNSVAAPAWLIASMVAMNVCDTVTTASPLPTPDAISAKRTASVPFATPTQYLAPQYSAYSRSKASTSLPPTNAAERTAWRKASTSSSSSSRCGVTRSRNGMGWVDMSAPASE